MANLKGLSRGDKPATGQGEDRDESIDGLANQSDAVDSQELNEKEVKEIGNLMNDEDDPEGWMSELVDYWEQLPPTSSLTRKEWLQHRVEAAKAILGSHRMGSFEFWPSASRRKCRCECDGSRASESKAIETSVALRQEFESLDGFGKKGCAEDGGAVGSIQGLRIQRAA
jgi:hypothetical protein